MKKLQQTNLILKNSVNLSYLKTIDLTEYLKSIVSLLTGEAEAWAGVSDPYRLIRIRTQRYIWKQIPFRILVVCQDRWNVIYILFTTAVSKNGFIFGGAADLLKTKIQHSWPFWADFITTKVRILLRIRIQKAIRILNIGKFLKPYHLKPVNTGTDPDLVLFVQMLQKRSGSVTICTVH